MGQSYEITGIILKGSPLGESDRLLTILSPEQGLLRVVAPGARTPKSPLRGRCEIFQINHFLLYSGKSLPRIQQIERLAAYPRLSQTVNQLTAGQYLGEVVLSFALTEQPQGELYSLFTEHLRRLGELTTEDCLHAYLTQALFHLLALGGFAPTVHRCGLSQTVIQVNYEDPRWQMVFSLEQGGLVYLPDYPVAPPSRPIPTSRRVNAIEVTLLQHLSRATLPVVPEILPPRICPRFRVGYWVHLEQLLRDYAQFHLGQTFRAPKVLDSLIQWDF